MVSLYVVFMNEPRFHPEILYNLALQYPGQIAGVTAVSHKSRKQSWVDYVRKQIDAWGWRAAFWIGLAQVCRRILNRLPGPRAITGYHSLSAVCRDFDIPYVETRNVNDETHLDRLRAMRPDI